MGTLISWARGVWGAALEFDQVVLWNCWLGRLPWHACTCTPQCRWKLSRLAFVTFLVDFGAGATEGLVGSLPESLRLNQIDKVYIQSSLAWLPGPFLALEIVHCFFPDSLLSKWVLRDLCPSVILDTFPMLSAQPRSECDKIYVCNHFMTGTNIEEVAVKGKNVLLTVRSKFQAQNIRREQ